MLVPKRAPVKPRVATGAALPLEDEIQAVLAANGRGVAYLLGPPGSGKTTALQHLAAVLPPDAPVLFNDEPHHPASDPFGAERLVVRTTSVDPPAGPHVVFRLLPWGVDEWIEYLLATHREQCASVMSRIHTKDRELLGGSPELWEIVLDELARSPAHRDARAALDAYLELRLTAADRLEARQTCLKILTDPATNQTPAAVTLSAAGFGARAIRVLRHPEVQRLLAAEHLALALRTPAAGAALAVRLPRELVHAVAAELAGEALPHLRQVASTSSPNQAMAASILHFVDPSWVPATSGPARFGGAYLETAVWPLVDLPQADLRAADLSLADLRGANLDRADAAKADLSHAQLIRASLKDFKAAGADVSYADLTAAQAKHSCWDVANLEGATFADAILPDATFTEANLTGTSFAGADLVRSTFTQARLKDTDFTNANLRGACLAELDLRPADVRGTCLAGANLRQCNLEGMDLTGTDFHTANLEGALLTGANLAGANLGGASLRETGLGDINLEGASLRNADLRGATFHMGSSRCGLLFTPIASEGTRTGFYTDDADDRYFKAPEEVRKANLCGADLRGAQVEGVDFYLVDLRGARYDADQEPYFRSCRAIL